MNAELAPVWSATRTAERTRICFPQPAALLNLNHRTHWRTRWRVTKQWRATVAQAALLLGPPSKRAHGPSFVRLIIPVPDRRRRDPHNLVPIVKAAVDGAVDAGIWPDDTADWVETLDPRLVHIPRSKGIVPTVELVIVPRTGETP